MIKINIGCYVANLLSKMFKERVKVIIGIFYVILIYNFNRIVNCFLIVNGVFFQKRVEFLFIRQRFSFIVIFVYANHYMLIVLL